MARRVVWTAVCYRDLEQSHNYIALDSPRYAKSFARDVLGRARWLQKNAELGAMVPEFGDQHVREVRVGKYRLIYKLLVDAVVLVGLVHGARDLPSVWERERRPK